ncbi:hypothetical protein CRUP_033050 [Coryphaenoides rupestris]|nr:hypothetical protein CRUP_033050 [Coryphaenoides rupestris]
MIDTVTGSGPVPFAAQLKALVDREGHYQPKLSGLRLIEGANDNGLRMTARLREFEVKDLLSLTRFFGFCSDTFSLAVSLLDRFLSVMKIQPKHLSCVGLCCFYIAVKSSEEERNVPLASDLIRITQNRFTVSDMMRMEKIVMEKLYWKVKAPTALHFLRLFHGHVQSQLDPSLLALALLCLEAQEQHDEEHAEKIAEALQSLQQQLAVRDGDLICLRELVGKCLVEYATTKCSKPNSQRLRWIISGRTQRQLKPSYYKIAHLPTIPETAC